MKVFLRNVRAIYLAQSKEFLRDRSSVIFVLLLPAAFGVFFGLVFAGTGGFILQLGLANEDAGPAGAELAGWLQSPQAGAMLDLRLGTRAELLPALEAGEIHALLVLPSNLSAALAAGETTSVDVFYDPSRQASAGIGLGAVRTLLDEANLRLSGSPRRLQARPQAVQGRTVRQIDYYMSGMLGVALLWLGIFGTAQPIVAQREAQILRRFRVTPVRRSAILAAEVSWRVSVGLLQTATFLAVGYLGFGVAIQEWLPFVGAVLLGTFTFVCLGYALAGLGRSTESTMAIAQLINFPMMMLSGSIFPADFLPAFFRPVLAAMPLTYLSDLLHYSMAGMTSAYSIGLDFAILGAWLAVLLALAIRFWRWE